MTKLKLASVLALIFAMSGILAVGLLTIIAAEPFGSSTIAAVEFPLVITIAAALTLVTVNVASVLRGRRQNRSENRNPYNPQPVNVYTVGMGFMPWQSGHGAFVVRYCDRCGNRI